MPVLILQCEILCAKMIKGKVVFGEFHCLAK